VLFAVFGTRSWSGQSKRCPKHTSKSEVTQNEGPEERKEGLRMMKWRKEELR